MHAHANLFVYDDVDVKVVPVDIPRSVLRHAVKLDSSTVFLTEASAAKLLHGLAAQMPDVFAVITGPPPAEVSDEPAGEIPPDLILASDGKTYTVPRGTERPL